MAVTACVCFPPGWSLHMRREACCVAALGLAGEAGVDLEGSGRHCRRLDGLPIDDGKKRGVHGLTQ